MKSELTNVKDSIKKMFNKVNKFFKKDKEERFNNKEVLVIALFSLGIGIIMSFSITNILSIKRPLRQESELKKFLESYNTIVENYYGEIDKNELINGAITGMTNTLEDPYTTYIDSTTARSFLETVEGTYNGIGCEIGTNDKEQVIITSIIPNTPASKSNLKKGDIILEINKEDFSKKNSSEVANSIKDNKEDIINLTVQRDSKKIKIQIKKEKIIIPSINSKIITEDNNKIGYIYISVFSSITDVQFKKELEELEKEKINSLIIDVRNNTGGYLDVVSSICSMLLKEGEVIYQLEGKDGIVKYNDQTKERRTYPIAIIINEYSASASEILASAIKESYGGFVVGTNSYGKGTAQKTFNLSDGSIIKYTNQKWLTPQGNWINKVGVTPTNYIEMNEEYYINQTSENDNQLLEAIKILAK